VALRRTSLMFVTLVIPPARPPDGVGFGPTTSTRTRWRPEEAEGEDLPHPTNDLIKIRWQ
jgi:hypothetical protein